MIEFFFSSTYVSVVAFITAIGAVMALVLTMIMYTSSRSVYGRNHHETRKSARMCIAVLFAAPVIGFLWPVIIPIAVVWGASQVVRDAIGPSRTDV